MCILPREQVVDIRCQPRTHPCPTCGKRGRRVRRLDRRIRSLAYKRVAWLHVHYAEYQARCGCRKSFRSWPVDAPQKADYDDKVRAAVLDRILEDGLNVERLRRAMKRDFLLELSSGFVYDCLDFEVGADVAASTWGADRIDVFVGSGSDMWHLWWDGSRWVDWQREADRVVGFLLVRVNDQPHLRRFLLTLNYWGFAPRVVVTDGSNLYPAVLAEVWPTARHQLCVFHVLQDVNRKILDAVRRLRRLQSRRGNRHGRGGVARR